MSTRFCPKKFEKIKKKLEKLYYRLRIIINTLYPKIKRNSLNYHDLHHKHATTNANYAPTKIVDKHGLKKG